MTPRLLLRLRSRGRVAAGDDVRVGHKVVWDIAPGASITLGDGATIGDRCRFHVGAGAQVVIHEGARLEHRCVITAHERIEVGAGAVLGEEAVLLDFDHVTDDVEAPVRTQGLVTAPVHVGEGARLEPSAVVLRGVTIGAGARVGVRAVVRTDIPAGASVGGVPARPSGAPPRRGAPLRRRR